MHRARLWRSCGLGVVSLSRYLRRLSAQEHWIHFRVYDDSFETYLLARAMVEEAGFSAGWMPFGADYLMLRPFLGSGGGREVESD